MRENEFKIWDIDKKEMYFTGRASNVTANNSIMEINLVCDCIGWAVIVKRFGADVCEEVKNFKMLEYTGTKDKNNKKIYEGDITNDVDYGYMTCIFKDGTFMWYSKEKFGIRFMNYIPSVEVIGNIYENPELLKCQ